jgi:hypothetical protein
MSDTEAHDIIVAMRDTAIADFVSIKARINKLKEEYEADGWDITAAQITRLETKLTKRTTEAIALAIAETKF